MESLKMVSARSLVCVLVLVAVGCETTKDPFRPYYSGQLAQSETILRDQVAKAEVENRTLLRLELASVLQAQGHYSEAAQLLMSADNRMEVLDYTSAPVDDVVAFAFAAESAWRPSPPERTMVNVQNMINFLGAGDLDGAAVEARRLGLLLNQPDVDEDDIYMNDFGWGLAGVILAANGDQAEAEDAFAAISAGGMAEVEGASAEVSDFSELRPPADLAGKGTILVVAQLGQAPVRREATYVLAGHDGQPHPLNLPAMQARPAGAKAATLTLDGSPLGDIPIQLNLEEQLMRRFDDELALLVTAGALQAGIRSELIEEGVGDHDGKWGKASQAVGEFFLAHVQEADVRCWSLLAGRYGAMRLDVEPGTHALSVALAGSAAPLEFTVNVTAGELALVNVVSGPSDGYRVYPKPQGGNYSGERADDVLRFMENASLVPGPRP